jgi:putative ABC transport system permease protein
MPAGIGLGTRLLAYSLPRLFAASASIAIAVVIMFVELGMLSGMLDSQSTIATLVRGDLVVMNITRAHLHDWNTIDAIRLTQIAAIPGVDRVAPIYEDHVGLKSPDDKRVRRIILFAIPPDDIPLDLGDRDEVARNLKIPHGFLFDRLSRPIFGKIVPGQDIEIDSFPLRNTGLVEIGPDIVNDGAIVVSIGDWLARAPRSKPIMGVIHLKPGVVPTEARRQILAEIPQDVTILTPEEARQRENSFTLRVAPIGIIIAVGVLAGLAIGTINSYQVLFNEVTDRLPQYATLKAMGFSDGFLRRVILEQAIVLFLLSFLVGIVGSFAIDNLIAWQSALPVRITMGSVSLILFGTLGMCLVAGLAAIRRVTLADPAALY